MGNNKNPRITFACDYCGEQSSDRPSHYRRKKRHFCSMACYSKYRTYILPTEEHNRYGKGLPLSERRRRVKARSTLNHAIRDGLVEREPCEVTTCLNWPEAHHDNYDKPLEVRWLCSRHHRAYHKEIYENPDLLPVHSNK